MNLDEWAGLLLPDRLYRTPRDIVVVVVLTVVTVTITLTPGFGPVVLRTAFGLVFVLFLPGYAFVAALFPEGDSRNPDDRSKLTTTTGYGTGIGDVERVLLSFGGSMAITPLVLLLLNFTPWGIQVEPYVVSTGLLTILLAGVGSFRRQELPAEVRYDPGVQRRVGSAWRAIREPEGTGQLFNVIMIVSVLTLAASISYAIVVPGQDEQFTEFYLLSQDDDGQLVADHYPSEYPRDGEEPLILAIENEEYEPMNYTVVVELQSVSRADNRTVVESQDEIYRFRTAVEHDKRHLDRHVIEPTMTGQRLRLVYTLYRGQAPADPSAEDAYRSLHLWINVTEVDTDL